MIALSLFLQSLIFLLIAGICIPQLLPKLDARISFLSLVFLFNSVSCYEYFRKRKVVILKSKIEALSVIHMPSSEHVSMAFFLIPRGIDCILTGRELTS